jgi:hypothetical protein
VTNKTKTRRAQKQRWIVIAMFIGLCIGFAGCGKPGDIARNYTNCWVTATLNGNQPLQSDVLSNGYALDDVIPVKLKSVFRALYDDDPTTPNGPSPFDTIVFHSYLITHRRSDGGPNPASFTGGLSLPLEPDSESEINIVVVRAFDKHRSPLAELRDDGEIFTTSIIVFYGTDGNGNDIEVSGSLTISYANFIDS